MYLVHVIPLSRGIFKETLSYFSSLETLPGSIVSVSVRGRKITGLVVSVEDASRAKASIKASPFPIKKIENVKSREFFVESFIKTSKEISSYFISTPGEIIHSFTPKAVLANADKLKGLLPLESTPQLKSDQSLKLDNYVLQTNDDERMSVYKSLIREEFAKNSSVYFCLPTLHDIETVVDSLGRGIMEYTYVLHSGLSKKTVLSIWDKLATVAHPVLVVATATYFSVPRRDIKTIIVDKENSRSYKTFVRPYVDIRAFAEVFAKHLQARLIFGDMLLRPETIWRKDEGDFQEFSPLKWRSVSTAENTIVDMKKYANDKVKSPFSPLSDELNKLINTTLSERSLLFILVGRRGLSPVTVCADCGTIHTCTRCTSPLVLHKQKDQNINHYVCHKCGSITSSEVRCQNCKSWRLTTLGTGIEKVEEEILRSNSSAKIFRIDNDTVKTSKKARLIFDEFYEEKGGILVATGMALPYIKRPIANSAVVGIDALFTIPDFRINEKIMNLLLRLRIKTKKQFLIQTRNSHAKIFEYIVRGNLLQFYRDEIEDRKIFGYPPFQNLIKITWSGRKTQAEDATNKLARILEGYEFISFPAFIQEVKGQYRVNTLIKMERGSIVSGQLLQALKSLPPQYVIRVDTEDIL